MTKNLLQRWALLPASGTSKRMGSNKLFHSINGKLVIRYSLELFLHHPAFSGVLVTKPATSALPLTHPKLVCCEGGRSRSESVLLGLRYLTENTAGDPQIWVHDAARPCLTPQALDQIIDDLGHNDQPAIVARKASDSIKYAATTDPCPLIKEHCDRNYYWQAQTPQIASLAQLYDAYTHCHNQGMEVTDEASALHTLGLDVRLIPCPAPNPKLTFPEDLALARTLLSPP